MLCEETIRGRARALRDAIGDGRVVFGTKALPNVAVLRLLREEGIGADVASEGELAFAAAAGLAGAELVVHGNNKERARSSRRRRAVGAPVVLDAPDEAALAAAAGVERVLVRVTLGVDADTHEAIRTGHHGSKFGLPPDRARALVADALDRGLDVLGVHVHVGSQLQDFDAQAETIVRLAAFAASCRDELGWVRAGRRPRRRLRDPPPPGRRGPRRGRTRARRGRDGADRVRRGGAAAAGALARARPLPRRPRRRHALPRRERQAAPGPDVGRGRRRHVGQPTTAALRRPLHGALGDAVRTSRRRRS